MDYIAVNKRKWLIDLVNSVIKNEATFPTEFLLVDR